MLQSLSHRPALSLAFGQVAARRNMQYWPLIGGANQGNPKPFEDFQAFNRAAEALKKQGFKVDLRCGDFFLSALSK
jgi:hypothetical protein